MNDIRITGWGTYLPKLAHTNETLPPLDEPASQEDLDKIGVLRRHWADDSAGEGIAEMAAAAARRALERAKVSPSEIDVILLANWTQRRYIPEFAPRLKHLLGADKAFAHDLCCACAGFLYGLGTAHSHLQSPRYTRALVVASETTSRRARPGSKATLVFGDAAGAFVVERTSRTDCAELVDYELATHGDQHHIMNIDERGWVKTHIKQQELAALAAKTTTSVLDTLLARNGATRGDLTWLVPHSGTAGVQAALAKALELPRERILTNLPEVGNVSSASIPVALEHFVDKGVIRRGDLVACTSVGTGWYAAAALFRL